MRQRTRKLVGTLALMVLVPAYALIAMALASSRLAGTTALTQTIFFAVIGLLWLIPAGAVIWWMQRADSTDRP